MWYIWRYQIVNGLTIDRGCFGRDGFTPYQSNWLDFNSEVAASLYIKMYLPFGMTMDNTDKHPMLIRPRFVQIGVDYVLPH